MHKCTTVIIAMPKAAWQDIMGKSVKPILYDDPNENKKISLIEAINDNEHYCLCIHTPKTWWWCQKQHGRIYWKNSLRPFCILSKTRNLLIITRRQPSLKSSSSMNINVNEYIHHCHYDNTGSHMAGHTGKSVKPILCANPNMYLVHFKKKTIFIEHQLHKWHLWLLPTSVLQIGKVAEAICQKDKAVEKETNVKKIFCWTDVFTIPFHTKNRNQPEIM